MTLSPEQVALGRRNFMKALAGGPPLLAFGAAAALRGPVKGGPVRAGLIGPGSQGKVLLGQCPKEFIDLRAVCDINPQNLDGAADSLLKMGWPPPRKYEEWRDMLAKEDIEAVIIATPLWCHAEMTVGCLDAGKHVLVEKMMAYDVEGCRRMAEQRRDPPLQGPRGERSRLRDARVPPRLHGDILVDRIQRLRPHHRGLHGHAGDHDRRRRRRGAAVRR
jgi:hypothetical protein